MSWQPIETAPRGVPVLVSLPDGSVVSAIEVAAFGTRQWHTSANLFECFYPQLQTEPRHWQPLPEPPK